MLDKHLRQLKEQALTPLAQVTGRYLHPTSITLLAGGCGVLAGLAGWQGWFEAGLLLWIVNRVLDGLDGTVARLHNKQSDFGGYLDILIDFVLYAFIPALLAWRADTQTHYLATLLLIGTFYVNAASWLYLSSILERRARGANTQGEMTSVTMPGGVIEGTETALFFGLFFLLPELLIPLFILMSALVWVTVVQRLLWALHHLD